MVAATVFSLPVLLLSCHNDRERKIFDKAAMNRLVACGGGIGRTEVIVSIGGRVGLSDERRGPGRTGGCNHLMRGESQRICPFFQVGHIENNRKMYLAR